MDGKTFFIGVLAAAALAGVGWFLWTWRRLSPGGNESEIVRLKKRYARLLGVPLARAYDPLERGIEERLRQNPGRPIEDCLREMIAELERDRR